MRHKKNDGEDEQQMDCAAGQMESRPRDKPCDQKNKEEYEKEEIPD
jgi:hypothetical protein